MPNAPLIIAAAAVVVLIPAGLIAYRLLSERVSRRQADAFGRDLVRDIAKKFEDGADVSRERDRSLYTLPWYVLVGEPGAGKTEAIRHSAIGFPAGLNKPAQGRGGTVNLDWWFARKAVLLDTAGRLMFQATPEWRAFLRLLRGRRPHCPINGVLLAIPVTTLLTDKAPAITDKAVQISQQLDAMQRELGVRFPVYVLLTKADKLIGFREFFDGLRDPPSQNQMLGWSNPAGLDDPFDADAVDAHLAAVKARLERRRLALIQRIDTAEHAARRLDATDALFAFPQEIARLAPRLRSYLRTIFAPTEWSDKPLFLRGIYFTSAMSEGAALDLDLADALGISPTTLANDLQVFARDKSYFLKDLFLEKCFPEGGLVTSGADAEQTLKRRRWRAWGAAGAVAGLVVATAGVSSWRVRATVGRQAALWHAVAANDRAGPDGWAALIDPATGASRAGERLPVPADGLATVGQLHAAAADLAGRPVALPWAFRPWDHGSVEAARADAAKGLYERDVAGPAVSAAVARLGRGTGPLATADVPVAAALVGLSVSPTPADLAVVCRSYADVPAPPPGATVAVSEAAVVPVRDRLARTAESAAAEVDSVAARAHALFAVAAAADRLDQLAGQCESLDGKTSADYDRFRRAWNADVNALRERDRAVPAGSLAAATAVVERLGVVRRAVDAAPATVARLDAAATAMTAFGPVGGLAPLDGRFAGEAWASRERQTYATLPPDGSAPRTDWRAYTGAPVARVPAGVPAAVARFAGAADCAGRAKVSLDSLPADAAGWERCVAETAAPPPPTEPDDLLLGTDPVPGPAFAPVAAAAVVRQWTAFRQRWNAAPPALDAAALNRRVAGAANDIEREYPLAFARAWTPGGAGPVASVTLGWSTGAAPRLRSGRSPLAGRLAAARQAIGVLQDALPPGGPADAALADARARLLAAADADAGYYRGWQAIAVDDSGEAARGRLRQLAKTEPSAYAALFPAPAADDPAAGFWAVRSRDLARALGVTPPEDRGGLAGGGRP